MITINIDISEHFQEFNDEFEAALSRALERVGQKCAQYAQDLSPPPITGNLRNSITHTVENNRTLIVGSSVETGTGIYTVSICCPQKGRALVCGCFSLGCHVIIV